ncbi:unnamed protein product [Boreogadus saida]
MHSMLTPVSSNVIISCFLFSISWARLFPHGHQGSQFEKGALYYDKLINALIESGIRPVVTLHPGDLPQALQDLGGWTNASIVEALREYTDFCFSRVVSHAGYGTGEHPPGIKDYVVASYKATHNMLKSHAEAWHVYNDKHRKAQGGKVCIALNSDWAEPLDPSRPEDVAAAERYLQFMLVWRTPACWEGAVHRRNETPTEVRRVTPPSSSDDNGDRACDSYNNIDKDIKVLKKLKVTLYHWELPLNLQNVGGWENETIVERFRDYADVIFNRLGDRVKFWITLNEPYIVTNLGYGYGNFAPGFVGKQYIAGHHLIKAHAEAWHLYIDKAGRPHLHHHQL